MGASQLYNKKIDLKSSSIPFKNITSIDSGWGKRMNE